MLILSFFALQAQVGGLAHINIQTKDIGKAKLFYMQNLQFREVYAKDMPDKEGRMRKFSFLQSGSCTIELMQPFDTSAVMTQKAGIIPHFALEVTNLDSIITALKKNNVRFKTELFERKEFLGGIRGVFIYGPEGEEIELIEYITKRPY